MEDWNINDYQGKRKDQIEFSEKMAFWSLVGIFMIIIILVIIKI